jgi:ADP-heptose:LPS heptosyltransferase
MKFLICAYTGLGNFILKTPLIKAISEHFPNAKIDLLCGSPWGVENVLSGSNLIRNALWCPESDPPLNKIKILFKLRKEKYDVVMLPFDSTPGYIRRYINFLNAKKVIMHSLIPFEKNRDVLIFFYRLIFQRNSIFIPYLFCRHEIDSNIDLIQIPFKINTVISRETFVSYKDSSDNFFNSKNYFCIQLFAANGNNNLKTWPLEKFYNLIQIINKRYPDVDIVLVGDTGDLNYLNSHKSDILNLPRIINLIGKTSIQELFKLLSDSRLNIGHDSGVMHAAHAIGSYNIILWGPGPYHRAASIGKKTYIVKVKNPSFFSLMTFGKEYDLLKKYSRDDCMDEISELEVMEVINSVLRM